MKQILKKKMIAKIITTLKQSGHKVFIVGGAVRDVMTGRAVKDVDFLTSAPMEVIPQLFAGHRVKIVGKAFEVCLVDDFEIACGRDANGQSNFPESDLALRDFTFNAMAFDPSGKKILDPFNGRKDLEKSMVRFTKDPDSRIKEDPLRMIRACRFAAMLPGQVSVTSLNAMLENRHLLDTVARERIRTEVLKAMAYEKPSVFFQTLRQAQLLSFVFPSLDRCFKLDGGPHHGETVFEHCMLVGDALPARMPLLRLAGFLHDAGKYDAAVEKQGQVMFPEHEKYIDAVTNDLAALRFPAKEIDYILSVILAHMRPLTPATTQKAARRLLVMLEKYNLDYTDFMRMRIADKKGNVKKPSYTLSDLKTRLGILFDAMKDKPALSVENLQISGNDIIRIMNIEPGPLVGKIKNIMFEKVTENPSLNTPEELEKICLSLKIKD